MTANSDVETFEVTCPFCGDHRDFDSIVGIDGAGQWLVQHREFHSYEIHQDGLEASFDNSSYKTEDK